MEQVYIFDFGDKIKAGYSTNVRKRLRTIELSSGVTAKQIYSVQAGRSVEKLLHNKLENRLLGEFFAFPFERAKELLDEIVANYIPPVHGGDAMDIPTKIKMAEVYAKISETELSRKIGTSPQAFNQRMKTGKFSSLELVKIAEALGAEFECKFRFPDGTEI